jgi:4-alpha-glucanotransferase
MPMHLMRTYVSLLIQVQKYLLIHEENDIPWELIQAALSSVAQTAVIPMQDILGLGNSARMNIPATQV